MNNVFFYITWIATCGCVAHLGNTWQQDVLQEGGKLAVWCFRQGSADKPCWVCASTGQARLATKSGPTQYWAVGHNVPACVFASVSFTFDSAG